METTLIEGIYHRIAKKSNHKFSNLAHPMYTSQDWPDDLSKENIYFFRNAADQRMPDPDRELLASLECDGVPTIHNMIKSDRIVSKLNYEEALRYSTFLVRRMIEAFAEIEPTIVIGAYDGIHGSLCLAVCRYLDIPWFCLHFSVIPTGLACFCDKLTPSARVNLVTNISGDEHLAQADNSLLMFEKRDIQAPAYVAPKPLSIVGVLRNLPKRFGSLVSTFRRGRRRESLIYTKEAANYSISAALIYFWCASKARRALSKTKVLSEPPADRFVFFGLHMQPESSVDVWAPFYSNQIWVIELLARSIPPSRKLLIKIHKSDAANYSRKQLDHITSLPGVEIVDPFADAQNFIRQADIIVSIQGTIGLEGALYGKPVIMLGDSPYIVFDSVSCIDNIVDLPTLVRRKMNRSVIDRGQIIKAYAKFMAPFMPASSNIWSERKTDKEIDGYVELFDKLSAYVDTDKDPVRSTNKRKSYV